MSQKSGKLTFDSVIIIEIYDANQAKKPVNRQYTLNAALGLLKLQKIEKDDDMNDFFDEKYFIGVETRTNEQRLLLVEIQRRAQIK